MALKVKTPCNKQVFQIRKQEILGLNSGELTELLCHPSLFMLKTFTSTSLDLEITTSGLTGTTLCII